MNTPVACPHYRKHYTIMAICVYVLCFALFYIDKDIKKVTDLINPGIIPVSLVYAVPTYLICVLFFRWLAKRYTPLESAVISLITGIPAGFALVITLLSK